MNYGRLRKNIWRQYSKKFGLSFQFPLFGRNRPWRTRSGMSAHLAKAAQVWTKPEKHDRRICRACATPE
jgi:hypothetical protein